MKTIEANKLGKGSKVILKCGWRATILDGYKNRSIRMAEVEGLFKEVGSIYTSDIAYAEVDGELLRVTLPNAQRNPVILGW